MPDYSDIELPLPYQPIMPITSTDTFNYLFIYDYEYVLNEMYLFY